MFPAKYYVPHRLGSRQALCAVILLVITACAVLLVFVSLHGLCRPPGGGAAKLPTQGLGVCAPTRVCARRQAFPPRDYLDPSGPPPRGVVRNLRIMFDVTDVVDDVHGVVDDTVRPRAHQPVAASCKL